MPSMMGTMPAQVTISTEEGLLMDVRVGVEPLTIGRAADNIVRSSDRNVSRHHAVIRPLIDGTYQVEDVGSSFGTFLNGAPVTRPTPLRHGNQLRVGDLQIEFSVLPDEFTDDVTQPAMAMIPPQQLSAAQTIPPTPMIVGADPAELAAAKNRIEALMDQLSDLRKEVVLAQEDEDRAHSERVLLEQELLQARRALDEANAQKAELESRIARMERELQRPPPPPPVAQAQGGDSDVALLQKQLREARAGVDSLRTRISEMEQRDAQALVQRKEIERLTEQLKQREAREAALSESLQPAMARITELSAEADALRKKLAFAETELAELRRRQ